LFRLKSVRWWTDAAVSHVNSDNSLKGEHSRVLAGGDIRLNDQLALGFGVGFTRTDMNTSAGGKLTSDGLNLLARGFWKVRRHIWFDTSLTYGYSRFRNKMAGVRDSYAVHTLGFGGGINALHRFNRSWRVTGRLGWNGSRSFRRASTVSAGTAIPKNSASFGRASLRGRLTRKLDGVELFGSGDLRLVTNDSSGGNLDNKPFDAELGGGFRAELGRGIALTGRGYTVLGRRHYTEYGGSLSLVGNF
jgi:hypothetical protein